MSLLPSPSFNPIPPEPTPEETARFKPLISAFGVSSFMDGKKDGRCERYPFLRVHWAGKFSEYLAQRWYDGTGPLPWISSGPLAENPEMLPLVQIARASGVFDLHDPLTASYWQDYLNGHPVRRMVWERYEWEQGQQRALYWNNAQGKAWEAAYNVGTKEAA